MSGTPAGFGTTVSTNVPSTAYGLAATDFAGAIGAWNTLTGTTASACKIFFTPQQYPTTLTTGTLGAKFQGAISRGMRIWLCYQPGATPTTGGITGINLTTSDRSQFVASITALKSAITSAGTGATLAGVSMFGELNDPGYGISAATFQAAWTYYGNASTGAKSVAGVNLYAILGANGSAVWNTWINSSLTPVPDGLGLDYYATAYVSGKRVDSGSNGGSTVGGVANNIVAICTALNIPWSVTEMGNTATGTDVASPATTIPAYLNAIQSAVTTWLAGGRNMLDCMWFDGLSGSPNVLSSSADYRIPALQAFTAAITASSSAAFTEVQHGAPVTGSAGTLGLWFSETTGGPGTGGAGQPSTQGTLLVARISSDDGSQAITAPDATWTLVSDIKSGTATSGVARAQVWACPGNAGGLAGGTGAAAASFTYANTSSSTKGILTEYSTPAGTLQFTDQVSAGASGTSGPSGGNMPVADSAANAHSGGLGIAFFTATLSGTPANTWTVPSGWTADGAQVVNHATVFSAYYEPGLAAGTTSLTGKINVTSGTVTGWAAALVTFYALATPLAVTTTTLPAGTQGTAYGPAALAAIGGAPPYAWALATGSLPLPPGLSLSSSGVITGTPAAGGTYSFTVQVTDSLAAVATGNLSIAVTPSGTLLITTLTVPAGVPGTAYGPVTLTESGGTGPFTWAVTSGALPPGLSLSTGGVLSGTPDETGAFTFNVTVTDSLSATATATFAIAVVLVNLTQQVSGTATFDYGSAGIEMATSQGSMLVVLAGWDLSVAGSPAPVPACWVTDSQQNYWQHIATSTSGVSGARVTAWACTNARAIKWISVSLTGFASSLAYTVLEFAGMPQFVSVDCADAAASASATSLALNPGVATDPAGDFAFGVLATGALVPSPAVPSGWTSLGTVSAGTGPNPVQIFPYYSAPAAGTSLAVTFSPGQAVPAAGIIFALHSTVYPPAQDNPAFPVLKAEAGFGAQPGDPSQAPPAWTDITNRVMAKLQQSDIGITMGRQYELAQSEAGVLDIPLDNHDGAFTPGNTESPFAPGTGVMLGTPVRVSAFWAGQWYFLGYGFTERWPQAWPDLPQFGISAMAATDAISAAAAVTMSDALTEDLLIDAPYVLLLGNESYLTFSNGVNAATGTLGFYAPADAQGLLSQNYSRVNQRSGTYVNGNFAEAATGQTTSLLGSAATGFGTTAISAAPAGPASGPGIIYTDPGLPGPQDPGGVTAVLGVIVNGQTTSAVVQPTIFTAYGPPSSYRAGPALTVQILNFTGGTTLKVTLADGTAVSAPFSATGNAQMIVLSVTASSLNVYVDGALAATAGLTAAQAAGWDAFSAGCPNYAYGTAGLAAGNFTIYAVGIYPYQVPVQRLVSQFATATGGQQNSDAVARMAQILSWAGLGLPRGGQVTFNGAPAGILQGPAYSLSGTTAADAIAAVAASEGAMCAAMPSGALVYLHREALFNQAPVAVFGDQPPAQSDQPPLSLTETPYLQATAWDYDNTYLWNSAAVTRSYGANNLFTVTAANFPSQSAYYARTAPATTLATMSNLDPYDRANGIIAKYSQPALRVSGLTVDAAANPAAAFPVILALQQGQVVTVTRRPAGGAVISEQVLVQQVTHTIGPGLWQTSLQLSPYTPENAVLQLDTPPYSTVGTSSLA